MSSSHECTRRVGNLSFVCSGETNLELRRRTLSTSAQQISTRTMKTPPFLWASQQRLSSLRCLGGPEASTLSVQELYNVQRKTSPRALSRYRWSPANLGKPELSTGSTRRISDDTRPSLTTSPPIKTKLLVDFELLSTIASFKNIPMCTKQIL